MIISIVKKKKKRWSEYDTKCVANKAAVLYEESLLPPEKTNHANILVEAQEILPEEKWKDSEYLRTRQTLNKKSILKIYHQKLKNSTLDSTKNSTFNIQDVINKQVNEKLENFSTFLLKLQKTAEERILSSLENFEKTLREQSVWAKEFSGEVRGTFTGVFEPKLKPIAPIPPPQIIHPPSEENEIIIKEEQKFIPEPEEPKLEVEYEELEEPPIDVKNSNLLYIAIVGVMNRDKQNLLNMIDHVRRGIKPYFYFENPDKLKVRSIAAKMDHIFITFRNHLPHKISEKLLLNYPDSSFITTLIKGSNSSLSKAIIEWSTKEWAKRSGE